MESTCFALDRILIYCKKYGCYVTKDTCWHCPYADNTGIVCNYKVKELNVASR